MADCQLLFADAPRSPMWDRGTSPGSASTADQMDAVRDADAMGRISKQPRQWCLGAVVLAVHRHNTDVKLRNVTMPIPVADHPSDVPHTEHLNCTHATYLPVHVADSCCGLQNFFKG